MAKSKTAKLPLLFVDTNIWLDFYRQRQSDVALELLAKLESVADHIVVTNILDMEYRKNRQTAIAEGLKALASPAPLATHGIFSQAKAAKAIDTKLKAAGKLVTTLRARLIKALEDPTRHDPVYKTCQRIFSRDSDLVLNVESDRRLKSVIRERAMRRFYLGCPPRKDDSLSLGDAVNWEWMVRCAEERNVDLVILTRDLDYGINVDKKLYVNDHLSQEFKDRVGLQRKVFLYDQSAQALKHFAVTVSKEAVESEARLPNRTTAVFDLTNWSEIIRQSQVRNNELMKRIHKQVAELSIGNPGEPANPLTPDPDPDPPDPFV